MKNKNIEWLYKIKDEVPGFLFDLEGKRRPGFYCYSFTGDYFGERIKWGLGNSVFFLKICYILNLQNQFRNKINDAVKYVKNFQKKDGLFSDPLIHFLITCSNAKKFDFNKSWKEKVKIAETRQSLSSLMLFDVKAKYEYDDFPQSKSAINDYLSKLDWESPWSAGSHFSHLLFFLGNSSLNNKKELIEYSVNWVNGLQNEKDGFWYKGSPDISNKINGAMKIITGFRAIGDVDFKYPEIIIDNILKASNKKHACDHFNIIYVLRYCYKVMQKKYRYDEVRSFMYNRLNEYKQHYHPHLGGFSFLKNKANRRYYGALISKGRKEPDIHGTIMFLWGISMIAQVIDLEHKLDFKEVIA